MAEYSLHFFDDVPLEHLAGEVEGDEIVLAVHGLEHTIGDYFDAIVHRYNPDVPISDINHID